MTSPYHHGNLREALLQRAIEVLNISGIESLSLRALARDLNVSHGAPLRHFKTKTDLLSALAIEGAKKMLALFDEQQKHPAGLARLEAVSVAYIDWALANPAYYRLLRNPEIMRHAPEELAGLLKDFARKQRAELATAQADGWRRNEDPETVFLHLITLTVGSAVVATDQFLAEPARMNATRDRLIRSLSLFFPP